MPTITCTRCAEPLYYKKSWTSVECPFCQCVVAIKTKDTVKAGKTSVSKTTTTPVASHYHTAFGTIHTPTTTPTTTPTISSFGMMPMVSPFGYPQFTNNPFLVNPGYNMLFQPTPTRVTMINPLDPFTVWEYNFGDDD